MKKYKILFFIYGNYFFIGLVNNSLGAIIPDISAAFRLTLTMTASLSFVLFIAYGITAIPAGLFLKKYREQALVRSALVLMIIFCTLLLFFPFFPMTLLTLFILGIGSTSLQVSLNYLLRNTGGSKNFGMHLSFAQLVFGIASFLFPLLYRSIAGFMNTGTEEHRGYRMLNFISRGTTAFTWVTLFLVFCCAAAVLFAFTKWLPGRKSYQETIAPANSFEGLQALFKDTTAVLFFIGMTLYVGVEIGLANWISKYLLLYHDCNPAEQGALAVSWFWGMFTFGTLISIFLLKYFSHRKILIISSLLSMVSLIFALWGDKNTALIMFPAAGFCISPQWPVIFSMAMNSVKTHHETYSGILSAGALGGAFVPLIIGGMGDLLSLRAGMSFLFICLGYVLFLALKKNGTGQTGYGPENSLPVCPWGLHIPHPLYSWVSPDSSKAKFRAVRFQAIRF